MTRGTAPTRRRVLAAAGASLLPRTTRAQPAKRRRIAILATVSRALMEPTIEVFREGLRAHGYGEEDIAIEIRYADGRMERLPDLTAELVRFGPEVIVAASPPAVQAAKEATSTIPIVMAGSPDPVATGFVASLAHPGGNVTGLSTQSSDLAGKLLQLLKTAVPDAERIAILLNPANLGHPIVLQAARQAARTLCIEVLSVEARTPNDIDGAFAIMARERTGPSSSQAIPFSILKRARSSSSRHATRFRQSISSEDLWRSAA